MGIPICGACRRPIEERVVTALGKHWHVEHFVCAKCEKPFLGNKHYERKGLAYCETHYHQLFGNLCYVCNQVIQGDVFTALNKAWCVNHFACSSCDQKMTVKTKFYEVDLKPVCKKCYDKYDDRACSVPMQVFNCDLFSDIPASSGSASRNTTRTRRPGTKDCSTSPRSEHELADNILT